MEVCNTAFNKYKSGINLYCQVIVLQGIFSYVEIRA